MKPLVSMIVPCYNAEKYIKTFLSCIAAQTWRPLELVLVDDGSTDSTPAIIAAFRKQLQSANVMLKTVSIAHQGQAAAMNAGLPLFTGEYLTWADADDFLLPEAVSAKVLFLEKHRQYGMVRHDAWNYDEADEVLKSRACRECHRGDEDIFTSLFDEVLYCYAGCYMIRTSLFLSCYPERRIIESSEGQNLQMLLPCASRTRCGYIDRPLMIYRIHSESHAHRHRNIKELVDREAAFCDLRLKLLDLCAVDKAVYSKRARSLFFDFKQQLFVPLVYTYKAQREKETRG